MVNLIDEFTDAELEWKPQTVGISASGPWAMVLCYVSARAIQDRLDAVYGVTGWKDAYRFESHGTVCTLSVFDDTKKEWISKENGSQETDIESFKGGISSAFKRVASSGFGIGRYLYSLDVKFANCGFDKIKGWNKAKTKDGKYFYWETPTLSKVKPPTPEEIERVKLEKEMSDNISDIKKFDEIKNECGLAMYKSSKEMSNNQLKKIIAKAKEIK